MKEHINNNVKLELKNKLLDNKTDKTEIIADKSKNKKEKFRKYLEEL